MKTSDPKLSGVFAPVVTPFQKDEVSENALRDNLRKLAGTGLTGYLALGSNGEYKSLTRREQIRILEVFAAEKNDKVIMVGTGCESTVQTIEKSKLAAQMGFDYVSVLTPSYFAKRMDGPTLQRYYERIADAVPIPVLLYNAPGFAGGVGIPPAVVVALARHPNIVGMKDSAPAGPGVFLKWRASFDGFAVLAGSTGFFYPALHLGAGGGVLSLANILPEPCCELYRLFRDGRYDRALDLHGRLARLNAAVSGTYGVAGVKAAMDMTGFTGGEPRHPLIGLHGDDTDRIRRAMIEEGFLTAGGELS